MQGHEHIGPLCLFLLLLLLLLLHPIGRSFAITDLNEVEALRAVQNSIGDLKGHLSNWKGDDPCSNRWEGVICTNPDVNQVQNVKELRLLNMNLTGTLTPYVGNFTQLQVLDVMWNNISGSIPAEIGNLQNLELLLLNGNRLNGTIPEELGKLGKLNRFQIDENRITGPIPTSFQFLSQAKHFHMNNNFLNGIIPRELGRIQTLVHLLLDNNHLNGSLPSELYNITTLRILQLDNNQFSGTIPVDYSRMSGLVKLSLRNCNLSGTLPDLSNLSKLAYLDLSRNQLTGPLPTANISEFITSFDVSFNHLNESIPALFSQLTFLDNLVLRDNHLTGLVPDDLGESRLLTSPSSVVLLDFQNNMLTDYSFRTYTNNVTIRLAGNPVCDGSVQPECDASNQTIRSFTVASDVPIVLACNQSTCDVEMNEDVNYELLKSGTCFCSSPLHVGFRLKSPSFPYFPPYEEDFRQYFSSGLQLLKHQVNITRYEWIIPGPRLAMSIRLFPSFPNHIFNASEVERLETMLATWKIPENRTYGPYDLLNFTLLYPYAEPPPIESKKSQSLGIVVGIALACSLLAVLLVAVAMFCFLRNTRHYAFIRRGKSKQKHEKIKVLNVRDFTFDQLADATRNFDESMQIGRGGYGKVYKGILSDGLLVAIKRAHEGSLQGSKEFYTELDLLSRVHHRNLVSLVGYCDEQDEQMLVYEFMVNGTLREHIINDAKEPLDFKTRFQIALGSARGILYLHTEANPPIYHRDIKPSNILLDERNRAKVADFGLSRLAPVPGSEIDGPGYVSTVVKGTPGYLDPEYFMTHKLTNKSDVYSYGVVLLELVTGAQAITDGKNLVREVNQEYESGTMCSIIDSRMGPYPSEALEAMARLAISCCNEAMDSRPSMVEVVRTLEEIWKAADLSDSIDSTETQNLLNMHNTSNSRHVSSELYRSNNTYVSESLPSISPR